MPSEPGRREAKKQATREALQAAADRLFSERGFEATTVRDIAEAVGVTERTFFRYFESKDNLVRHEAVSWLPILEEAIRSRPADEPPLVAAREAVRWLTSLMSSSGRRTTLNIFNDALPINRGGRGDRTLLLILEQGLADALSERVLVADPEEHELAAEVAARAVAGILRSAVAVQFKHRDGDGNAPTIGALADRGFALLAEGFRS